jgi:hypothetical protein
LQNFQKSSLDLFLEGNCLSSFYSFLQCGIKLKTQVGISVNALLTREFGLDSKHIAKIETIFLDGKTVDDLEASIVKDGSILALSSAMPGLVGATLRRGSFYAAMRSQITAAGAKDSMVPQQGMVTLKLFNLVIKELGPIFLKRGIWIAEYALHDFLTGQPREFWRNCKAARLDGHEVSPETLLEKRWPNADGLICLRVDMGCPEVVSD